MKLEVLNGGQQVNNSIRKVRPVQSKDKTKTAGAKKAIELSYYEDYIPVAFFVPRGYKMGSITFVKDDSQPTMPSAFLQEELQNTIWINNLDNFEKQTAYDIINKREESKEMRVMTEKRETYTFLSEALFLVFALFLILFGIFNLALFSIIGKYLLSPYISIGLIIMGIGWGSSIGIGLFKVWRHMRG